MSATMPKSTFSTTDLKIAMLLVGQGVQKSDIVLAFQSPFRRTLIPDFAMS
jgi:XisI protein